MSLDLSRSVWSYSPTRGIDLLVLLAVADATEQKSGDGWCWLSLKALSDRCRCSPRYARMAVSRLVKNGALQVLHQLGPHGCNKFRIVPPDAGLRGMTRDELLAESGRKRRSAKRKRDSGGGRKRDSVVFDKTSVEFLRAGSGIPGGAEVGFRGGRKRDSDTPEAGFHQDNHIRYNIDGPIDEGKAKRHPPSPPLGGDTSNAPDEIDATTDRETTNDSRHQQGRQALAEAIARRHQTQDTHESATP